MKLLIVVWWRCVVHSLLIFVLGSCCSGYLRWTKIMKRHAALHRQWFMKQRAKVTSTMSMMSSTQHDLWLLDDTIMSLNPWVWISHSSPLFLPVWNGSMQFCLHIHNAKNYAIDEDYDVEEDAITDCTAHDTDYINNEPAYPKTTATQPAETQN